MAQSPLTLRIAMLNADEPAPAVCEKRAATYGQLFHVLLSKAADRVRPNLTILADDYDVVRGEYPPSASDYDLLIVTGAAASAYDDLDWARNLDVYLSKVYEESPRVRMFGSCFGHQIICQSLLRKHGVTVEKNPQGWEVGVHEIQLNNNFLQALGPQPSLFPTSTVARPPTPDAANDPSPKVLRLQLIHSDHVKVPEDRGLPAGWMTMGRTDRCAIQGTYCPGRVLTYQGHFEFDRFVNAETLKVFGAKWERHRIQDGLNAIEMDDDSDKFADFVVRFLLEGRAADHGDGLITPM
ncbi:hypothetical protein N3K66_001940 [Trichothecium roseum]|uniref:Uncharacterized protein n=1 Tax=Trichothecium roseum TaxID=47278 RepID=A0ACC0VAU7_9HYPO|nr:hypothetical protein N3K66_001940 [Trichothecium roseum]